MNRPKLSDILHSDAKRRLEETWGSTQAAKEFAVVPRGEYLLRLADGRLATSRQRGTPSFKAIFEVVDGEHSGQRIWHDFYLTEAAIPGTKRDLAKLGITDLEQLDGPVPQGIIIRAKVSVRRNDKDEEVNVIRSFQLEGIEEQKPDAFAPKEAEEKPADPPPAPVNRLDTAAAPKRRGRPRKSDTPVHETNGTNGIH